jgi:very-short-patch-repair endonuclease
LSPAGGGLRGWRYLEETKNLYYNKYLKPNANKLRKSMTKAEACLWKYVLKARLMKGYQFRRERPVLNYIADFMCKELKLIVEVDGITHHFEENYLHDLKRQEDLESLGFKVVRFMDNDVLGNIEGVKLELERVVAELEAVQPQMKKVHPLNPPPAGENEKVNSPPAGENE